MKGGGTLTIEQVRKSKGVSKIAMCRILGVTYPTYSRLESNPQRMTVEQAIRVCDFLDIPYDVVFFSN